MKNTFYKIFNPKLDRKLRIVLISDLHDRPSEKIIKRLSELKPDIIAIPGDLTSRLDCLEGNIAPNDNGKPISHKSAFSLLDAAASIAPTYYSLGNHELCGHKYRLNFNRTCLAENLSRISQSGAVLLNDTFVNLGNIRIGGLTSGMTNPSLTPYTDWLEGFSASDVFKILLCHHPEYYEKHLRELNVDLILSGHAHGGQIRLFGQGLFAPAQGFFPKYTSGVHENRMVVGRGLANTVRLIPRLFNPTELVTVDLIPKA
jgi:predicted MPP superfamily phosphohydrolase